MKKRVIWPLLLLCSSLLTALVVFLVPTISIRPVVVMWFLFICPGMAWVRLLRLHSNLAEWTIALALSFALDALVAGIFSLCKSLVSDVHSYGALITLQHRFFSANDRRYLFYQIIEGARATKQVYSPSTGRMRNC